MGHMTPLAPRRGVSPCSGASRHDLAAWRLVALLACLTLLVPNAAVAAKAKARPAAAGKQTKPSAGSSKGKAASGPGEPGHGPSSDDEEDSSRDSAPASRAARNAPATPVTTETLAPMLDAIIRPFERSSRWGVCVAWLQGGKILYQHNVDQRFIPASNRKVFTGALALDQLGPDFKFRTYLYRTGKVRPDGALEGNLVVRPSGDPTFSNRFYKGLPTDWIFRDWVTKVKAAGIRRITGDLLVDCSDWDLSDLQPKGWATRILGDKYALLPSPLTLNENLMGIKVKPGAAGAPPIIEFWPPADGYTVLNQATTGGKGTPQVRRLPTGPIEVSGQVGTTAELAIPCDNPALFAAAVLRHRLREGGIELAGAVRLVPTKRVLPPPTEENVLAAYESPALKDIVAVMMKQSNNHYAEQLFVAVSAEKLGRGGYRGSRQLEDALLRRAGVDAGKLRFDDGCGLSENNRVGPEDFVKLLAFMATHPAAQAFYDSMSIAGVDGTLRNRMHSPGTQGKLHGKTGFINGVTCLSGYIPITTDRTLAFSILVNDCRGGVGGPKAAQDRICETLSRLLP